MILKLVTPTRTVDILCIDEGREVRVSSPTPPPNGITAPLAVAFGFTFLAGMGTAVVLLCCLHSGTSNNTRR